MISRTPRRSPPSGALAQTRAGDRRYPAGPAAPPVAAGSPRTAAVSDVLRPATARVPIVFDQPTARFHEPLSTAFPNFTELALSRLENRLIPAIAPRPASPYGQRVRRQDPRRRGRMVHCPPLR